MPRPDASPSSSCSNASTVNQPVSGYSSGSAVLAAATHISTRRVPSSSIKIPPWIDSAAGSTERAATIRPISAAFNPTATPYSGTITDSMSHTPLVNSPAPSVASRSRSARPFTPQPNV